MENVRLALEDVDAQNDNAFFVECFRTGFDRPGLALYLKFQLFFS